MNRHHARPAALNDLAPSGPYQDVPDPELMADVGGPKLDRLGDPETRVDTQQRSPVLPLCRPPTFYENCSHFRLRVETAALLHVFALREQLHVPRRVLIAIALLDGEPEQIGRA